MGSDRAALKLGLIVSSRTLFSSVFKSALLKSVLLGAMGFVPILNAPLAARQSVNTSSSFEVGGSRAGSYLSALVAGADRDTLAAATYFLEALRYDPSNRDLLDRAFIAALANGNYNNAFTLAERTLRTDPKNSLAHLVLGLRAFKQKQYSAARAQIADGGGGRQRDITALLINAWAFAGSGDYRHALEQVDRLQDQRVSGFRDYHGALIAALGGQIPQALTRMQSAYNGERTTLRIVDAYARLQSNAGFNDEAMRAYKEFDQLLPRHPIVTTAIKQMQSGRKLDLLVMSPQAGAAEVLYGLGAAGGQQNDELAAMIYLRLALYLDPTNALAQMSLGDLYERVKQYERALDVYEQVADASPLRVTAEIQSANVLEQMGRGDEALAHMKAIVTDNPRNEDAIISLAGLQRSHKQFAEAAKTYSAVLDAGQFNAKGDWVLWYFRGISYERSKQWPLAEADFKKALSLNPDQPLVLNYLGYSWVDQNINLDAAFTMLRKAVDLRPSDGYVVDSLGWAYYRLGNYDEALRNLERAVAFKPGDSTINDHLGDIYWKLGRKLEAQFQWNHARDLKPEPEDLPAILSKIEKGLDDHASTSAGATAPASAPAPASTAAQPDAPASKSTP
jgi:tetratricopeptide (TPR) repeat protein